MLFLGTPTPSPVRPFLEPLSTGVLTTEAELAAIADFMAADETDSGGIATWICLGGAGLVLVAGGGPAMRRRLRPEV